MNEIPPVFSYRMPSVPASSTGEEFGHTALFDTTIASAESSGPRTSPDPWRRVSRLLAKSMERALTISAEWLAAGSADDPWRAAGNGDADPDGPRPQRRDYVAAVSFWGALTEIERRAFRAVAHEHTFPSGTLLMREGEPAHHVMVILRGRTKISVLDSGAQRILAERGPGQLVGERAALELNVRSATVVAVETTEALIVTIEEFWDFLQEFPAVRAMVEGQSYDRRTDGQQRPGRPLLNGQNCTIIRTDVVGFSQHIRNDEHRLLIRRANLTMTAKAMDSIWDSYSMEDRGDGLLMVVRPDIPTQRVIECLLNELPPALRKHNSTYAEAVRIQLRVAVDVGPVVTDALGISGEAIIRTSRLLEAGAFKTAIRESDANLGIIASTFVYDSVIKHAAGLLDPARYSAVQVDVKESSMSAWMQLID